MLILVPDGAHPFGLNVHNEGSGRFPGLDFKDKEPGLAVQMATGLSCLPLSVSDASVFPEPAQHKVSP